MKPIASLSLDLDNEWSYLKTRGDASWTAFPSYLDVVVPRFLEMLRDFGLRITVFVVGQDAALEKNADALRAIAEAGHEIGCHSFKHEPWLHRYTLAELDHELTSATDAITAATGARPVGFRGPGFSLSRATLETLVRLGYRYDCTTFPTYIGPLARRYYFWTAKLSKAEREQRDALFGSFEDGRRPLHGYVWDLDGRSLVEIPVTTFPVVKLPIHFSYLLYLTQFAPALAEPYFRSALAACRFFGVEPSLLLHPLDFLCADDVAPSLRFFPAMALPLERKLGVLRRLIACYRDSFSILTVGEHAAQLASRETTPHRSAAFGFAPTAPVC